MGFAISQRGQILLTGGTNAKNLEPHELDTVKEQAILGAEAARKTGCAAPWVGVDRSGTVDSTTDPGREAFIVHTDLGHKRNCLEACLCDAAVALEGGDGTVSEAVFTLSLGKPVVFIGNTWNKYKIGSGGQLADFAAMVNHAFRRVSEIPPSDAPLNGLFNQAALLARLSKAATYEWFPAPNTQGDVLATTINALKWLQKSLGGNFQGNFPGIPRYAKVAADYDQWVKNV